MFVSSSASTESIFDDTKLFTQKEDNSGETLDLLEQPSSLSFKHKPLLFGPQFAFSIDEQESLLYLSIVFVRRKTFEPWTSFETSTLEFKEKDSMDKHESFILETPHNGCRTISLLS
jgi:hypothetical protein